MGLRFQGFHLSYGVRQNWRKKYAQLKLTAKLQSCKAAKLDEKLLANPWLGLSCFEQRGLRPHQAAPWTGRGLCCVVPLIHLLTSTFESKSLFPHEESQSLR